MINMTAEQLSELTRLRDSKRYPDMYRYMLEVVTTQKTITHDAQALDDLTTAQTWLNVAISVNSNDGQFPNQMVRGSMQFAAASKGKPLSDTEFQKGSDKLAWNIADSIIKNGGFPPINDIMKDDRDMTVDAFGLESWQWPGTIADTFPPSAGRSQPRGFDHPGPRRNLRKAPQARCHAEPRRGQSVHFQLHRIGHASRMEICH